MKVALFITSTRQLNEIDTLKKCLDKNNLLKTFDLYFHNNNHSYNVALAKEKLNNLPNQKKYFIYSQLNTGYVSGALTAIEENFELLSNYDIVITFHADVFPISENIFISLLQKMLKNNFDVLFTRYLPAGAPGSDGLLSDLFVFVPAKINKRFFSHENCAASLEGTLNSRIKEFNLNCLWVERYDKSYESNYYKICKLDWWHSHNISEIDSFLQQN